MRGQPYLTVVANVDVVPRYPVSRENGQLPYSIQNLPVILSDGATVFHLSPAGPWGNLVPGWVPDLLSPDNILQVQGFAVIHNPLSHAAAKCISVAFLHNTISY